MYLQSAGFWITCGVDILNLNKRAHTMSPAFWNGSFRSIGNSAAIRQTTWRDGGFVTELGYIAFCG